MRNGPPLRATAKGRVPLRRGMPLRLVSPGRVLYIVEDRVQLKALVEQLDLGWHIGGNLRQLCGWEEIGDDLASSSW